MKNIETLLSEIGITIPEDKKKDFETAFNEYMTMRNNFLKTADNN